MYKEPMGMHRLLCVCKHTHMGTHPNSPTKLQNSFVEERQHQSKRNETPHLVPSDIYSVMLLCEDAGEDGSGQRTKTTSLALCTAPGLATNSQQSSGVANKVLTGQSHWSLQVCGPLGTLSSSDRFIRPQCVLYGNSLTQGPF